MVRAFAVLLLLCLSVSCTPKAKPSSLVIYTSVPESFMAEIESDFSGERGDIRLSYIRAASETIIERFKKEASAGQNSADIIWVSDFALAEGLRREGLLQVYISPESRAILPWLKDPEGNYCAARLLDMVLAYNTDRIQSRPKSYSDMLRKEYRNKIGIADPQKSGASLYAIAALAGTPGLGWNYVETLLGNGLTIMPDNESLIAAIAEGTLWMGFGLDYLVRANKISKTEAALDYAIPMEGAILIPSPIAIAAGAKNQANARAFVDYILSKKGQRFISSQGVAPVRLDVIPPNGISSITQMRILPADPQKILESQKSVLDRFKEAVAR